jgi:hypothetical protein
MVMPVGKLPYDLGDFRKKSAKSSQKELPSAPRIMSYFEQSGKFNFPRAMVEWSSVGQRRITAEYTEKVEIFDINSFPFRVFSDRFNRALS